MEKTIVLVTRPQKKGRQLHCTVFFKEGDVFHKETLEIGRNAKDEKYPIRLLIEKRRTMEEGGGESFAVIGHSLVNLRFMEHVDQSVMYDDGKESLVSYFWMDDPNVVNMYVNLDSGEVQRFWPEVPSIKEAAA